MFYVDTDRATDDWKAFENFTDAQKYYREMGEGFNKILYEEKNGSFNTISQHSEG